MRLLELLTLGLVAVIAGSFVMEIVLARPAWGQVLRGFAPGLDPQDRMGSLYVAIAMLGATVMPHNLYLHSALVQTRAFPQTPEGKRLACRYNLLDSTLALNGDFFINAAILVLAASHFHEEVKTLQEAHELLGSSVWGGTLAGVLFAVALLASGQSSTLTGTLAGQVVMEGFVRLRVRPWVRRLLTRSVAIVPALVVLSLASAGDDAAATDERLLQLLVLSQAILSFQLPFAIIPLVQFTSDRRRMGIFASPVWLKALAWLCAVLVIGLNIVLIWMYMGEWAEAVEKAGWRSLWIYGTVGPISVGLAGFLVWIAFYSRYRPRETDLPAAGRSRIIQCALSADRRRRRVRRGRQCCTRSGGGGGAHPSGTAAPYPCCRRAGRRLLWRGHGRSRKPGGSVTHGRIGQTSPDRGSPSGGRLGYGDPPVELVRIARERQLDFLVLGTHGHRFFADLALGQTVAPVLHRLQIPILVVPNALSSHIAPGLPGGTIVPPASRGLCKSGSPNQDVDRRVENQADDEDTAHEQHHGTAGTEVAIAELLPFLRGEVQCGTGRSPRNGDNALVAMTTVTVRRGNTMFGMGFVHACGLVVLAAAGG